jgi:hypothetical protein
MAVVCKQTILTKRPLLVGEVFFFKCGGGTLDTVATTGLLYQPQMIGEGDCGEIGEMKIGRGNQSTWRKPAPPVSTTNPT